MAIENKQQNISKTNQHSVTECQAPGFESETEDLERELADLRREYNDVRQALATITNSRGQRAIARLKNMRKKLSVCFRRAFARTGVKPGRETYVPVVFPGSPDIVTVMIEYLAFNDNVLELRGRLFTDNTRVERLAADIVQRGEFTRVPVGYPHERRDISALYGNADIGRCGFFDKILAPYDEPAEVYLILKSAAGEAKIYIGRVTPGGE